MSIAVDVDLNQKVKPLAEDVSEVELPRSIKKRDGREVEFDISRIERAIRRCFDGLGRKSYTAIPELATRAVNILAAHPAHITVERCQDAVELTLQAAGEFEAAKAYILYRALHAQQRQERPIPDELRHAFADADRYFPTPIQKFQFFDKYSRFDYGLGRRETWLETVERSVSFLHELVQTNAGVDLGSHTYERIRSAILNMQAMPSMRLLSMAGDAARRDNACIYNCTYLPVDSVDAFCETMLLSMAGCGVGFSVEHQYVEQFPRVKRQSNRPPEQFLIEDSSEGWAAALRLGMLLWFEGHDVQFDYSQLRAAGVPLRTKGGRSSGPEPLRKALSFIRARMLARQGRHLRTIDAHDMMCMVGNAAVSGGMRRTAMISLFDYDDIEMRTCKTGDFERDNDQRWNANNSAVWPESGLDQTQVIEQVMDMVRSQRGEPGIFNRKAALDLIPQQRKLLGYTEYGCNPCGEVILRKWGMCNLSISVARADDTFTTLRDKVEVATIIGTIQSLATHFPYLRPMWKANCELERLLGVDITGQMDCPLVWDGDVLRELRGVAVETNRRWANLLGINQSASVTCVKPSGNSAQLLGCSSGLHARWSAYYERNARVSAHSPIFKVLRDAGVPMDPENKQDPETANTWVVHFPVASPPGAITRKDRSAIQQCEYWLHNKRNWTTHNPSCTITYYPNEVIGLLAWIWEHRDEIGGMAFLPAFDAQYDQLPYIEISQQEYERRAAAFPEIDYARLWRYESTDLTEASQQIACLGGTCETDGVAGV